MNHLRGSVVGLAGLVGAGLLAWPVVADDTAPDGFSKRDEQETELVTVEDDDTRDKSRDQVSRDQVSRQTRDASAQPAEQLVVDHDDVSRDRDLSRDVSRDVSRDASRDDSR